MNLYRLGKVPWLDSQLAFHALARMGREALVLVSPATPYVCIGLHQDADQEVDLDFCREHAIPVFRREVGGGAVYLDGRQLFFQLILRRDNPVVPARITSFYRKFLQPVIDVHHDLGIRAEYKPVNDLLVDGRKISGSGAGEIGDCVVFVGNLILDFDVQTMARVLKVPDEKFRDKIRKTLADNMTTIRRELGGTGAEAWDEARLYQMLARRFETLLGPLEPMEIDDPLREKMDALGRWMHGSRWLHRQRREPTGREVRIRSGLEIVRRVHKAAGGLMRLDCRRLDGVLEDVRVSGDFFAFPAETVALIEKALEGCPESAIQQRLELFFEARNPEMPGVTQADWLALLRP